MVKGTVIIVLLFVLFPLNYWAQTTYQNKLTVRSRLVLDDRKFEKGETYRPTVVQGMYHPQYYGRNGIAKVTVTNERR